ASAGRSAVRVSGGCRRASGGSRPKPAGAPESREPDLEPVPVAIGGVGGREAGRELTPTPQAAPRPHDRLDRGVDVGGIDQPKSEMVDPAARAHAILASLEREHVEGPGSLYVDLRLVAKGLLHAENLAVETQGPLRIGDREADVREPVRPDHESRPARAPGARPDSIAFRPAAAVGSATAFQPIAPVSF